MTFADREGVVERIRRALPLLAWLAALAAGIALFHGMGAGPLAAPPLTDPAGWAAWAAEREPLVAGVAILRLLVLGLAWYLVGVTTIGLVARLLRAARLIRVADALTVPAVRRLLQGALGLGLATAVVGAATVPGLVRPDTAGSGVVLAAAEQDDEAASPRLRAHGFAARDERPESRPRDSSPATGRVTMRLDPDGPPVPPAPEDAPADAAGATGSATLRLVGQDAVTLRMVDAATPATHEVRAGESLWSIAQDRLAATWGREPTDAEVLVYWRQVIDMNRSGLADPDNPDLIFPGQPVQLPPVAEPPSQGPPS